MDFQYQTFLAFQIHEGVSQFWKPAYKHFSSNIHEKSNIEYKNGYNLAKRHDQQDNLHTALNSYHRSIWLKRKLFEIEMISRIYIAKPTKLLSIVSANTNEISENGLSKTYNNTPE